MANSLSDQEINEILDHCEEKFGSEIRVFVDHVNNILVNDPVLQRISPLLKTRVKDRKSVADKIRRKHDPETRIITKQSILQHIEDLGGVRMVVYSKPELKIATERISELEKQGCWRIQHKHFYVWRKDRFAVLEEPVAHDEEQVLVKASYRSRHFILRRPYGDDEIRCELQLRTILEEAVFENMHRLIYKREPLANEYAEIVLAGVAEMCAVADELMSYCYRWITDTEEA